jgi:hypothetical protein
MLLCDESHAGPAWARLNEVAHGLPGTGNSDENDIDGVDLYQNIVCE